MDDGAFMWLRVMELMIRSWVDFQLRKASPIALWISVAVWNGEPASSDEMSDGKNWEQNEGNGMTRRLLVTFNTSYAETWPDCSWWRFGWNAGVCAHFSLRKGRATNYIICVFERQPGRSHVWPGGCRRRDPSSCLRAVKWSRWRAAEEDIIQRLIILSGSRRALCFAGCRRWRGGGDPGQTSGVTVSANEWTMAIHQSSMPACLTAWNQLQCPSQSNLIPSADSFISLTSFAIRTGFLKRAELDSGARMSAKILNLRGNQWPAVQNIARSAVGERWSLSQYHGGSFISLMDCLSVSPEQTCIWVAGGKFGGVLFSGAVAQACTSPSANWPRRVIRT